MNKNMQLSLNLKEPPLPSQGPKVATQQKVYVLLTIQDEYYLQMRDGIKKYEYRRKFRDHPTTIFLYVNSPVSAVSAKVEFDKPIVGPVHFISEIAEGQRKGSGPSVQEYLAGLDRGYAIPILSFEEIKPVTLDEIVTIHPRFRPPQLYIILNNYSKLLSFLLERSVR